MSTPKEAFESADPEQDLRFAARRGDTHRIMMLLQDNNLNVDANYGAALREASEAGKLDVVKILLAHGANPFVLDAAPLRYAKKRVAQWQEKDDIEIVHVLQSRMESLNPAWQPSSGPSPFDDSHNEA